MWVIFATYLFFSIYQDFLVLFTYKENKVENFPFHWLFFAILFQYFKVFHISNSFFYLTKVQLLNYISLQLLFSGFLSFLPNIFYSNIPFHFHLKLPNLFIYSIAKCIVSLFQHLFCFQLYDLWFIVSLSIVSLFDVVCYFTWFLFFVLFCLLFWTFFFFFFILAI